MLNNLPILVVEDSDEDFSAFMRVMQELPYRNPIHRVCDGDDALDYLHSQGSYLDQTVPLPGVIVMDLNLPGTDGRDVIQAVKQEEFLKSIPIVVLTTSLNPKDIETCYRYGVNSYLLKPTGVTALRQTIRDFFHYWFETNILPTHGS